MKKLMYISGIFGFLLIMGIIALSFFRQITPAGEDKLMSTGNTTEFENSGDMIQLPPPKKKGTVSIEEALQLRRSVRSYASQALTVAEVGQLLWSAQGITHARGFRTAPSAGATFPLEMFVLVNNVDGLRKGLYQYLPADHQLLWVHGREVASDLVRASHSQSMIAEAGVVLVFGAVFERTTQRYSERGVRYVYNEIGHASQNVHLQAAALNLGTVVIGAYNDEQVEEILGLDPGIRILYMMPVGKMP